MKNKPSVSLQRTISVHFHSGKRTKTDRSAKITASLRFLRAAEAPPSAISLLRYKNYYPAIFSIVRLASVMAKKLYFLPTFSSPKQRRCNWNVAPSM
ncbi:MAG: hypothetical protein J6E38_00270, partial [Clostridia bacterium]|nr:hypothetical protein [Clostridia bacterium]